MGLQATFITLHIICFFLNIPPLFWHIMSKNIPAIMILIYSEIMMINGFIGAVVWGGSNYITAWDGKGWCDLMIRFQLAIAIGISSSISCVSLNLLMIFLTNKATNIWFNNRWIKPTVEIFCSIIFPFIISGVVYFAQTSRYMIIQYSGCYPILTTESISIVVFYLWIFLWSFIGTLLSLVTLFLYFRKRRAAREILVCTNSGLSVRRFIRLLSFCILVICSSIVFSAIIGSNLTIQKDKFYNEKLVHGKNWGFIFKTKYLPTTDTNRWVLIYISFISFILFGIGQDAKTMYVTLLNKIPFFGKKILNLCGLINTKFNSLIGNSLINNEAKYILKFWGSADDDDDGNDFINNRSDSESGKGNAVYEEEKEVNSTVDHELHNYYGRFNKNGQDSSKNGMFYSPSEGCQTAFSDTSYQIGKKMKFGFEDNENNLNSAGTVGSNNTMSMYYEDSHLRNELQQVEREINDETIHDELKYLYY